MKSASELNCDNFFIEVDWEGLELLELFYKKYELSDGEINSSRFKKTDI